MDSVDSTLHIEQKFLKKHYILWGNDLGVWILLLLEPILLIVQHCSLVAAWWCVSYVMQISLIWRESQTFLWKQKAKKSSVMVMHNGFFTWKKYIYMTLHATYVIFSYFEYCDPAWFCCTTRKRLENSKHVRPNGVGPRSVTLPKKSREKTFRSEKERCCSIILWVEITDCFQQLPTL